MLWLAIIFSLFGFVIAAPGAVIVRGVQSRKEHGLISAAGPVSNIVLALLFLILLFTVPATAFSIVFLYGVLINGWLALFNMIPVLPFDGAKVWRWSWLRLRKRQRHRRMITRKKRRKKMNPKGHPKTVGGL